MGEFEDVDSADAGDSADTIGKGAGAVDPDTGEVDTDVDGHAEADGETAETPPGRPCPLCGASMQHRHCKYICPTHGVVYDCADTFY